jgi:BirA family biotin operon repressor/biotin-[acetyl-CoA-carboxylase] ligase
VWISPDGRGIYLSVGWTFDRVPADLSALSLAVGASLRAGLIGLGAQGVELKWPNDLLAAGGKLGGILIEMRPAGTGAYVVVGVGINLKLPTFVRDQITALGGLEPRDLTDTGIEDPDEVMVGARLVDVLLEALDRFSCHGFASFRESWMKSDFLYGQQIEWMQDGQPLSGIACGIGADGALLVNRAGIIERLVAGEVTLRRAA